MDDPSFSVSQRQILLWLAHLLGFSYDLGGLERLELAIASNNSCIVTNGGHCLSTIFLELPISVVKGTDLSGFKPSRNAMEVEGVLWLELAAVDMEGLDLDLHCKYPRQRYILQ